MLVGNLTRDPELRYTPAGVAVCSFGLATNRSWTTQSGEKKEDAQFHRIVAWNKLAELCSQLLVKGRRVYVEGRIQYREYTGSDGAKRQVTEAIIDDMIILDSRSGQEAAGSTGEEFGEGSFNVPDLGAEKSVKPVDASAKPAADGPDKPIISSPADADKKDDQTIASEEELIDDKEEKKKA